MNRIFLLFSALILTTLSFAQAPQGINYQGVARDNFGSAISKKNIGVQFKIRQNAPTGTLVYSEVYPYPSLQTDTFGLYTRVIGGASGTGVGTFSSIPWSSGNMWIEVMVDDGLGGGFISIGNTQLMSVPYALYAGSSNGITSVTGTGPITTNTSGNAVTVTSSTTIAAGTVGSSTAIPVITYDTYGRITSVSTQTFTTSGGTVTSITVGPGLISSPSGTITASGGIDLPTFAGVAGPYGSSNSIPTFTVDSYGRITAIGTSSVSTSGGTVTTVSVAAGTPIIVTNPNTTPTLSMPPANMSTSGYLDKNDWISFNNKISTISPSTGIVMAGGGGTYTISAQNGAAIWNANQLQSVAVNPGAPANGQVLQYNGSSSEWIPTTISSLPTSTIGSLLYSNSSNTWTATNPSNIFTDGTNFSIGTSTPNGLLQVANSGSASSAVNITNTGSGYGLSIQSMAGGTNSALNIYSQANSGSSAYITNQNSGNSADALYVETKGSGNAIKGYTDGAGSGVFGYSRSNSPSSAGVYGMSDSLGSAGIFHVYNPSNYTAALDVMTQGSGFSGKFMGGAGLQTDLIQITGGAPSPGMVLTSTDAVGNATWQTPSGSALPTPSPGSILYADGTGTWQASSPSNVSSDGNSIAVTNNVAATAATFSSSVGTGGNPVVQITGNDPTGYGLKIDANSGAGIIAVSGGPYAIGGYISSGSGNAIEADLTNGSNGHAIGGILDATSQGIAGYFDNQNPNNPSPTLFVTSTATVVGGYSAQFSGGKGVQIDKLQVQSGLNIPLGSNNGFVLTSDATGNATWQAPAATGMSSALSSGNIFVGNAGGVATGTVMTGDAQIANTGSVTVKGLRGTPVSATAPTANQVLQFNAGTWAPATLTAGTVTNFAFTNGNGFTGSVINPSTTPTLSLTLQNATSVQAGQLTSADWNTFNNKVSSVSVTAPVTNSGTAIAPIIGMPVATNAANGYLSSTDWIAFNGKLGSGLASANIFVGNAGGIATPTVMSGDATMANTGAVTLSNSGVAAGTYGNGSQYAIVTVNSKGLVTSASTGVVPAAATGSNGLSGTGNITLGGALTANTTITQTTNNMVFNATTGGFQIGNTGSASTAFQVSAAGTGPAGTFTITNGSNSAAALIAGTAGTGAAIFANGPLKLGGVIIDGLSSGGASGDFLVSQGAGVAPRWTSGSTALGSAFWSTSGNAIGGANFIGTTNAFDLILRTTTAQSIIFQTNGSVERMRVDPNGNVGIGLTSGFSGLLHVRQTGSSQNAAVFEINNATNTAAAVYATTNSSSGNSGYFANTNASNSATALYASHNGSGNTILGANTGSGTTIYGSNSGTGSAGTFQIANAANSANGLNVSTNGTGNALVSTNVGTSGSAANFTNSGATNGSPALMVSTSGTGNAGNFQITNGSSASTALSSTTSGSGFSGSFSGGKGLGTDKLTVTNGASPDAVLISSNAGGDAIWAPMIGFAANNSSTAVASAGLTPIIFSAVEYNNSGSYNNATGVFTAPAPGIYHFDAGVALQTIGNYDYQLQILKNGGTQRVSYQRITAAHFSADNTISADIQLNTGETVSIGVYQTAGPTTIASSSSYVFFTGHKIR